MFNFILFTTFIFCVFQLICSSTAVETPACLLACVNRQPNPSAYGDVCRSTDVRDCLTDPEKCEVPGPAPDYFQTLCAALGHEVAPAVTSTSSSAKSSSTAASVSQTTSTSSSSSNTSATDPGSTDSGASSNLHNTLHNFAVGGTMTIILLAISVVVL